MGRVGRGKAADLLLVQAIGVLGGARGGGGDRLRDVAKLRQTLNHSRLRSWGQRVEKANHGEQPCTS